jgi:hypothetical protein
MILPEEHMVVSMLLDSKRRSLNLTSGNLSTRQQVHQEHQEDIQRVQLNIPHIITITIE